MYQAGMILYLSGDWQRAKNRFNQTFNMIDGLEDGPSMSLLEYMGDLNYECPADWKGYRIL